MKRLTRLQSLSAVFGAGLLIAAASGSAFARHTSEVVDQPRHVVHHQSTPARVGQSSGEVEFQGVVGAMTSDTWIVGGHTVAITTATEIKTGLSTGKLAKVHAVRQADGSLWAREVEPASEIGLVPEPKPTEDHTQVIGHANDNSNGGHNDGNDKNNSNDTRDNVNNNEDKSHVNTSSGNGNIQDNNNANDDRGGNNVHDDKNNHNNNGNDDHGGHSHGSSH